jgi:ATP-dependent protease HslVU (ClpYQ) peptidase subunit
MKQSLIFTIVYAATGIGLIQAADHTFTGEIMDSQCAQMGSHDNMMKGEGAKNAKECTIACVKSGGKYALYDPSAKKAYQLDNQKKAADYAGQKVTITGTLDSGNDSIHITGIQPGS